MLNMEIQSTISYFFRQNNIQGLLTLFNQEEANFNYINIATWFNRLGKLVSKRNYFKFKTVLSNAISTLPRYDFNSQAIANILNALAKWNIDVKQPPYSSAITSLIEQMSINIAQFNSQEIANSLNALAKWNIEVKQPPYSSAITSLIKQIPINIAQFNSQEIANSLNALAKWNIDKQDPYSLAITSLIKQIPINSAQFNSQDIANSLNALAKWNIDVKKPPYSSAITSLIKQIPIKIAQFNSQAIVNSLNALAKWNIDSQQDLYSLAITSLIKQIPINIAQFNSQAITNILRALCVFDREKECIDLWSYFQTNLTQTIEVLEVLAARQIYQAYLYFHPKNHFMRGILIDTIQKKFIPELKKQNTTISHLQKDVCQYVRRYLINQTSIRALEEEYFIEYTRVDIALPEKKLVIQVNGPCHYLGDRLNPETRFNNRLLEKLGWSVVTIPYFEWDKLTPQEKFSYLGCRLDQYVNHYSPSFNNMVNKGSTNASLVNQALSQEVVGVAEKKNREKNRKKKEQKKRRKGLPQLTRPKTSYNANAGPASSSLRFFHFVPPPALAHKTIIPSLIICAMSIEFYPLITLYLNAFFSTENNETTLDQRKTFSQ